MKTFKPRAWERGVFLGEWRVRPLPDGTAFPAQSLNVGSGGLAVFCNRFLQVGQPVEVTLAIAPQKPMNEQPLHGWVAYARVELDGNVLGIAFTRCLDPNEVRKLVQKLKVRPHVEN